MTGLQFFLVRDGSECYTVVVEDSVEAAQENLAPWFNDVKYLKSEPLNCKDRTKYKGTRKLGDGIIRGCWFSYVFAPTKARPLMDEENTLMVERELASADRFYA